MGMTAEKIENLKTIVLEKVRARVRVPFTQEIFDHLQIDQLGDMISMDMWLATIDLLIPGKVVIQPEESEYVPATWWDHFKMDRGWKYKKRRIVTVEKHYFQCPHISPRSTRTDHLEWLYYAGEPGKLKRDIT